MKWTNPDSLVAGDLLDGAKGFDCGGLFGVALTLTHNSKQLAIKLGPIDAAWRRFDVGGTLFPAKYARTRQRMIEHHWDRGRTQTFLVHQ